MSSDEFWVAHSDAYSKVLEGSPDFESYFGGGYEAGP